MSNADPRRPEKVQRFKPAVAGAGGNPNEDLTPDYMNILGPDSTTGESAKASTTGKPEASTASNIIPTSAQYGVAIIPKPVTTSAANDVPIEVNTQPVDTITDSLPKTLDDNKDVMHSTPSKNDRFKVVKIASSEPFRRGRWKCMDYVDQTPAVAAQPVKGVTSQAQQISGGVYLQTQSLPPQQIQQLLLQGGFTTTSPQFYQNQMVPQTTQFFYQPHQIISGSVPAQFVAAGQSQQYFTTTPVVPQNFQNVQFVQPYQSAFVPTTQQYQHQPTYTVAQTAAQSQQQPLVNGFAYTPHSQTNINTETKPILATSESQHSQVKTEPVVVSVESTSTTRPTDVYTNPQFVASVHSIPAVEVEAPLPTPAPSESVENSANPDDPGKTNPVVNAIDNKIEQAMDLVKSHLMYTVREEVEVLKEKIAELMERIQQLESENNYLRSQLPKNNSNTNATNSTSEPKPPPS